MQKLSGVPLRDVHLTKTPLSSLRLDGRRVAVVGGTGGLGRALAKRVASLGARVTVVGQTFRDQGVENLEFIKADLSLMSEARRVARELDAEAFDTLILTTGIFAAPRREVTAEGIERDLAVSYLSRYAILEELRERLGRNAKVRPRVFVMGFPGTGEAGDFEDLNAEQNYESMKAHMNTVAGNEALVVHAAAENRRFGVFGLNPGLIKTDIRANALGRDTLKFKVLEFFIGLAMISPEKYAERMVPVLFAPELDSLTGIHFNQKGVAIAPSKVMTAERAAGFIAASAKLLARKVPTPQVALTN
jgi:NAD(P)-dependent dehydrogenase (short-subunit alcohol dehydrogenase family)